MPDGGAIGAGRAVPQRWGRLGVLYREQAELRRAERLDGRTCAFRVARSVELERVAGIAGKSTARLIGLYDGRAERSLAVADVLETFRGILPSGDYELTAAGAELWRAAREDHGKQRGRAQKLRHARDRARPGQWHLSRAGGLWSGLATRRAHCGVGWREVHCGSCGGVHECVDRCRARHACGRCARKYCRDLQAKLIPAIWAATKREERRNASRWKLGGRGRRKRRPMMHTFTLPHTRPDGSPWSIADRFATILEAFHSVCRWLGKVHGCNGGPRGDGRLTYIRAVELTPGQTGLGHVHLHVVWWLPFVDFAEISRYWSRLTGARATVRASYDDRAFAATWAATEGQKGRRTPTRTERMALYLAKYATKGFGGDGGLMLSERDRAEGGRLTDDLAAQWFEATYNRRIIQPSDGFWVPWKRCPDCHELDPPWAVVRWTPPADCVTWIAPIVTARIRKPRGSPRGKRPPDDPLPRSRPALFA